MRFLTGFMAAGAVGLSLAFTAPANALSFGDNFTIDETCGGSGQCSTLGSVLTDIDRFQFSYTATIHQDVTGAPLSGGDDAFFETGVLDVSSWVRDNDTQASSPLNFDYNVYALFSGEGTAIFNAVSGEIEVTFTSFSIDFYMDANNDTTFSLPVDPSTGSTTVANDGDDNLIGTANMLVEGVAFSRADAIAQGDFEIVLSDFGLEVFGEGFFTDPNPFYSLIDFDGNAGQIILVSGNLGTAFNAQQAGSGQGFFLVPEPGTLGLLGGGLVGAAALLRRRKAAKAA